MGPVAQNVISAMQGGHLLETKVFKRVTQKDRAEALRIPHSNVWHWRQRAERAGHEHKKSPC